MSKKKESLKNTDSHINVFEQQKRVKISANNTLELAKKQEKYKLSNGFKYLKIDNKTMILKRA